jgi:cell division protein FtsI (penicillin-binding protein 3)
MAAPLWADLTDRNGQLLATSIPIQSLYADPKLLFDMEATAKDLAKTLPHLKENELLAKLKTAKRFVWIERNLTPKQVEQVNALGHPGLEFQSEHTRFYPAGNVAAHVVGYNDVDGHGLAGVERGLEKLLATGGAPVALSIDMRLQHLVRRELQQGIKDFSAIGGSAMVMDVKTGEMLAAVSLPDFDPHKPTRADDDARFNRFAIGTYELGSVFKALTVAVGLETEHFKLGTFFDASEPLRYGKHKISDFHPEGRPLSTAEVFIHSSNVGAARMALDIGPALLHDMFGKLGLTERMEMEISENSAPLVPGVWRDINAMTISFGHGIAITPLQFMRAMRAVVGDGRLITPHFTKDEKGAAGKEVLSPQTVDAMRRLMRANVVLGSGKNAEVAGYYVGGKTGTAEKITGKHYAANARLSSFIAAFPMHDPQYLIYVMVDEPKPNAKSAGYATGGWVAAPVVGRIVAKMAPLYGLKPVGADDPAVRAALSLTIASQREQLASF